MKPLSGVFFMWICWNALNKWGTRLDLRRGACSSCCHSLCGLTFASLLMNESEQGTPSYWSVTEHGKCKRVSENAHLYFFQKMFLHTWDLTGVCHTLQTSKLRNQGWRVGGGLGINFVPSCSLVWLEEICKWQKKKESPNKWSYRRR